MNRPALDLRQTLGLILVPVLVGGFWYGFRPDTMAVMNARGVTVVTPGVAGGIPSFLWVFAAFGILPAVVARVFRWDLTALGLGTGKWRDGLMLTALGIPLAVAAGYIGSRGSFAATYPLGDPGAELPGFIRHATAYLLYYIGFEFFFRGFVMRGVARPLGTNAANLLQATFAMLFHLGRVPGEVIAALPSGLLFGWLTHRTGSIWYAVIIHWVVGVSLDGFLLW